AGVSLHTLESTDTVLQLSLHAGLAGGSRLLWLKDVDQAVRHVSPDWAEFVSRARSWNVGDLVAVVLRRSRAALNLPVENTLLRELVRCPSWQAIVRASELISPPQRTPTSRS